MKEKLNKFIEQYKKTDRSARALLLITVLSGVFFAAWGLYFNFFILSRGYDRSFLGIVTSAFPIAIMIFGLPMGMVSDKIGRKKSMIIGQTGFFLGLFAMVLVNNPILIVLSHFVAGMSDSLYIVSEAPLMSKLVGRENRARIFSINSGLYTFSSILGNYLAGHSPEWLERFTSIMPKTVESYQTIMIIGLSLALLTFIPLFSINEPLEDKKVEVKEKKERPKLKNILKDKTMLQFFLPNLSIGMGAALIIPYLNLFFVEKFAISEKELGMMFSLAALFTGTLTFLGPALVKKVGSLIKSVVLVQGGSIFFLLILGFSGSWSFVAFSFLIRGAMMNMAHPLFNSFAIDQVEEMKQATLMSVMMLGFEFGWAIGPFISGIIQERYGYSPLFIITAILYSVGVFLTWRFFGNREKEIQTAELADATI